MKHGFFLLVFFCGVAVAQPPNPIPTGLSGPNFQSAVNAWLSYLYTGKAPATSGSSILKGNGSGGFSNAASGTDYAPATSGSSILKGNGSGGFSAATSGTDYAPATSGSSVLKGNGSGGFSTATLGDIGAGTIPTGSTIAIPQWAEFQAGVCQGSTASVGYQLPASSAASAACKTGTNTQLGVAQFTASGQTVQGSLILPDDWTSVLAVEFRFISETAASTGNVVWDWSYACVASTGASLDPSFASNQTVTVAAGANNNTNTGTISTPTISGCSAGQRMFWRIQLDASTTAAGNQDLVSWRLKIKRTVTTL